MNTFLSQLPKIGRNKKKRLGRGLGSGRGAKSGRGTTRHQKARESIPLHFEGGQGRMVKKFPLLRGKAKNRSIQSPKFVLSLETLNVFGDGETITIETLKKKKLIDQATTEKGIKILSGGKLARKLNVAVAVSKSAAKAIEKAGGTIKQ